MRSQCSLATFPLEQTAALKLSRSICIRPWNCLLWKSLHPTEKQQMMRLWSCWRNGVMPIVRNSLHCLRWYRNTGNGARSSPPTLTAIWNSETLQPERSIRISLLCPRKQEEWIAAIPIYRTAPEKATIPSVSAILFRLRKIIWSCLSIFRKSNCVWEHSTTGTRRWW